MMRKHLAIAFAAIASLAAIPHAEARPRVSKNPTYSSVEKTDIAARPAYPTEAMPGTAPGGPGHGATARLRTTAHSRGARRVAVRASQGEIGAGTVRSAKTGATARVAARYRDKFQAYVDDLEAAGAAIRFMGGFRGGSCAPPRHKHPCGMALDVCQLSRGVVDGRCRLPSPATTASIAARHGLTEGAIWCHTDYGHVEVGASAGGCASKGPRGLATITGKMVRPKAAAKIRHRHVAERGASRL